jgi:hypothetical protein
MSFRNHRTFPIAFSLFTKFIFSFRHLSSGLPLVVGTTHLKAKEEFAAIRAEQGRDLVTWLKSIAAGE